MNHISKTIYFYCIAYALLLTFVVVLLDTTPKLELHLMLNSYHTKLQDSFFKYYSMIAEGPIYVLVLLPLLWKKYKFTLFFGLCEISGGSILQVLKHLFSSERPSSAFEHYSHAVLPIVNGIDLHHSNSFPSGHASTFFMFFTCCAIYLALRRNRTDKPNKITLCVLFLMLLVLAALGGFSRIYLSQHFLSDVCVGSIIGFVTPFILFHFAGSKIFNLKEESLKKNE